MNLAILQDWVWTKDGMKSFLIPPTLPVPVRIP